MIPPKINNDGENNLWCDFSVLVNITELASRMYLHPATMVGLLERLELKGLVQRTRSDRDRRVVHVSITDQGRELVRNSPEVAKGLLAKGLEPLTEKKVKVISDGLEEIVTYWRSGRAATAHPFIGCQSAGEEKKNCSMIPPAEGTRDSMLTKLPPGYPCV